MTTTQTVYFSPAQDMSRLSDGSVDLVVTSPPYPMVSMWDSAFSGQDSGIAEAMDSGDYDTAFELMHIVLGGVWSECARVLRPGGIMCINIGDAVRMTPSGFRMFGNVPQIADACWLRGFTRLPGIIWRKPANTPNKFMGSGVLPCGAYVTLEHEHILVFRKGGIREFASEPEKMTRRQSAMFWEERNEWYSDMWNMHGVPQTMEPGSGGRERSGAFPLAVPYRLVNMFSVVGDTVLDPFAGTGTTLLACCASGRSGVGFEIDPLMSASIYGTIGPGCQVDLNEMIRYRYQKHIEFAVKRVLDKHPLKHRNKALGCDVMSSQETDIVMRYIKAVKRVSETPEMLSFETEYHDIRPMGEAPGSASELF